MILWLVLVHSASSATPTLEELLSPYELVGEIGTRPTPLYAVKHVGYGGKSKLLVAERFDGAATVGNAEAATFVEEARRLSTVASPNVARVREVAVRGEDLFVFWDFVDGDKLERSWLSPEMGLDLALRFILDVLAGAGAIHGLRDARQRAMQLSHGEISPATVLVGVDGAARLLHTVARRLPGAPAEPASYGYLAPEVHVGEDYDARADVFSAGVLLWEALGGARLFADDEPAAIVSRVKGGLAQATPSEATPWARALVPVAAKALAFSPADRWPSAGAMASEIRKASGLKLASASAASAFAKNAMGARANARRERLESGARAEPAPSDRTPEPTAQSVPSPLTGPMASTGAPAASSIPPAANLEIDPDRDVELLPESLPPAASRAPAPPMAVIPPLPQRALQSVDRAPEVDLPISIAPAPASVAPPPADSAAVWPTSVEHRDDQEDRATRRRRVAVLGSVGAFGLLVFLLAGWRVAHTARGSAVGAAATPAALAAPATPAALAAPATLAATAALSAGAGSTSAEAAERSAPVTPPAAATAAATAQAHSGPVKVPATSQPAAVAAAKPSPAPTAAAKKKAPVTPSHGGKTHHSGFDPNSL